MTEYRGALSRVARVTCARALKTARRGMSDARHRWAMGRGTLTPRPMARADPFAPRARYVAVDASFAYALADAELYLPISNDCATGFWVDGVCCNEKCDGPCDVCAASLGATADGTCTLATGYRGDPSCAAYVCNGKDAECPTSCFNVDDCATGYVATMPLHPPNVSRGMWYLPPE